MLSGPSNNTAIVAGVWSGVVISVLWAIENGVWGFGALDHKVAKNVFGFLVLAPLPFFVLGFDALPKLSNRPVGPELSKFAKAMGRLFIWVVGVIIFALAGMLAVESAVGAA